MDPSLSYSVGAAIPGPCPTPWERFEAAASEYSDSIALVAAHQPANHLGIESKPLETSEYGENPYLRWTYGQLRLVVDAFAKALSARGLGPGAPIFTFVQNGVEYIVAWATASLLGAVLVPLNIKNLINTVEVAHMIKTALMACKTSSGAVIADSPDTAGKLAQFDAFSNMYKLILGTDKWNDWKSFNDIFEGNSPDPRDMMKQAPEQKAEPSSGIVLFTSGTTGLPKGLLWSTTHLSWFIKSREELGSGAVLRQGDVFLSTTPNNHAIGALTLTWVICNGATLVYPGPTFDPVSFIRAAKHEKCTHTAAAPPIIFALQLAKASLDIKLEHLKKILLGGSVVTTQVIMTCVTELGVEFVDNSYGTTEGSMCYSGYQRPEDICIDGRVCHGRPLPGTKLKICRPGTREVVKRGEVGELHGGGPMVKEEYIGQASDIFYEEGGMRWMATGDQGMLDSEGRLFITGRYKDLIIRGGVNISPTAVEGCIVDNLPHLVGHQPQVMGTPDAIAGEVPVVVVALPVDAETVQQIHDVVVRVMGQRFALAGVIYIGDLGLDDFPRTSAGKVKKRDLGDLVRKYRQAAETASDAAADLTQPIDPEFAKQVKQIWARIAGVDEAGLTMSTKIANMGDSITLMRVKNQIYKQMGIDMGIEEIFKSKTMGALLRELQARVPAIVSSNAAQYASPDHPPGMEDMVHIMDDPELFDATKSVITDALKPRGLDWDSVRDVIPVYDLIEVVARDGTLERWCFKVPVLAKKASVKELRAALLKAFANNPMQSSFVVWDDDRLGNDIALQFTVDQKQEFLDNLIEDRGTLKNVADLKQTAVDTCMAQGVNYPGPLSRVYLYHIEESDSAGLIYDVHHAVTDGSTALLFFEDLNLALCNPTKPLRPHVPYKLYCDHFYNVRTSPGARAATRYHVQKLKGLSKHKHHFFPSLDLPLQIDDTKADGYEHTFSANGVQALVQSNPKLEASVIVKAAMALFLLHTSQHTHAIFASIESARDRLPFLTNTAGPEVRVGDVGGQVLQSVLNLVSLVPAETSMAFLQRMQVDQIAQTKYSSAPWKEIMRALDPESAELFPQFADTCEFNWLGSMGTSQEFESIELLGAVYRRDLARFQCSGSLVRGPVGAKEDKIAIHVWSSVYSIEEARGFAVKIEKAMNWMIDNLEAPVERFEEALRS